MSKWILVGIVLVAIIGIGVFGFSKLPKSEGAPTETQQFSFASVLAEVGANSAILYDVRTPEEFGAGRYEKAINYPLQNLQAGSLPPVEKTAKIYVYCRSGNRSDQATKILKGAGYSNVIDLKGLDDVAAIGGKIITN
jgi:phage shock protein E